MTNASASSVEVGRLAWTINDVTAGSEDGAIVLSAVIAGSLVEGWRIGSSGGIAQAGIASATGRVYIGTTTVGAAAKLQIVTGAAEDINAIAITQAAAQPAISVSSGTQMTLTATRSAAGQWQSFADGTDTFGMYNRAGSPESQIAANIGSYCLDTANGAMYIKTTDTANTGWGQLATVAATANTALSNLASVAINTALLPGTDNSIALGSTTKQWSDLFLGSGAVINNDSGATTVTFVGSGITLFGGSVTQHVVIGLKEESNYFMEVDTPLNTVRFHVNDGSPEGVITADKGSMCCDTTNGTLYMKTTDSANTGWKLVTQAA
jgi:hypothetical protein